MSKRESIEFVNDIKVAINNINSYIKGLDYKSFLKDNKTMDAVVHNIEIIGEASKNIDLNLKKKYPEVSWKKLAGIRDKIAHFYFGVNYEIVWDFVKNKLPEIKKCVNNIIRKEK